MARTPASNIPKMGDDTIVYGGDGQTPLVERVRSSVFQPPAGYAYPAKVTADRWVEPPQVKEVQDLMQMHEEGKFFAEHPWKRVELESAYDDFQSRRNSFRPTVEYRVSNSHAPNCEAHLKWFNQFKQLLEETPEKSLEPQVSMIPMSEWDESMAEGAIGGGANPKAPPQGGQAVPLRSRSISRTGTGLAF